jgi:hypothetical protein
MMVSTTVVTPFQSLQSVSVVAFECVSGGVSEKHCKSRREDSRSQAGQFASRGEIPASLLIAPEAAANLIEVINISRRRSSHRMLMAIFA